MTAIITSAICWFGIRRKLDPPKETNSRICDIPDINTASVGKTATLELKENVAYGEISH